MASDNSTTIRVRMSENPTTAEDCISFEDRLRFSFCEEGCFLTVSIANVQHVLMPEEVNDLRNWLLPGEEVHG